MNGNPGARSTLRPNRVLFYALLVLALSPAVADGRVRSADLAVARVTAAEAQDGQAKVSFTISNRGATRSRRAVVRVTIGRVAASVVQRPLRPRARARRELRVGRLVPGSWRVTACVRTRAERVRGNDCARAPRRLKVRAPAFASPPATAGLAATSPSLGSCADPVAHADRERLAEPVAVPDRDRVSRAGHPAPAGGSA
jgi:hypothetical protein